MINSQRGKRVVDLCIYVDQNAYKENHDKEKLFDAIHNIVIVLAVKAKLFKNWKDYEGFALEYSGNLYKRLTNPRQFLPDNDPRKLKKIKSILNYIKKTMYPMKVDYQKEIFSQRFDPLLHEDSVNNIREKYITQCRNQSNDVLEVNFRYYLAKITNTVKRFLRQTPYREDPVMLHNLYLSCMLTLLNQITLSNHNKNRYKNRLKRSYNLQAFLNTVFLEELQNSTILFHLPDTMKNYVSVLVARIRKLISKDLFELIGDSQPSDAVIQAIMGSSMEDYYDQE